ncbi:MAG: HXXEE domain-containing protein [Bacteroidota bacterium]
MLKRILWLIPTLLAVHNLEEALTMPAWVKANMWKVREAIPLFHLLHFSTPQLYLSLIQVTVLPFLLAFFCLKGELTKRKLNILLTLQAIIFWNVLVPHLGGVIVLQMYNPGTVTAVLINLPFSLYLLKYLLKNEILTHKQLRSVSVLGLIVYLPAVYFNHLLASLIVNSV